MDITSEQMNSMLEQLQTANEHLSVISDFSIMTFIILALFCGINIGKGFWGK